MQRRTVLLIGLTLAAALPSRLAGADEAPTVLHVPQGLWEAGRDQSIDAEVVRDWQLDHLFVGLRRLGSSTEFEELPLLRASSDHFVAVVPARLVQPPGVEYFIASQSVEGDVRFHFADATAPHAQVVHGETPETQVAERLARHRGHRSELRLSGEWTRYGRRIVETSAPDGSPYSGPTDVGSDHWWITRVDYTYRLVGILYDIHFGIGLLRADWPTVTVPGAGTIPVDVSPQRADPGLNFGRGGVTLEAHRYLSFQLDLLLGASQDGFVAGFSGLARVGRIAGTCFEISGELLQDLGNLGRFRFAWDTVERFPMAVAVEIDDRPGGPDSPLGSRLLFDVGFEVTDQLTVTGRGGYAARSNGREGGFVVGLATGFEF